MQRVICKYIKLHITFTLIVTVNVFHVNSNFEEEKTMLNNTIQLLFLLLQLKDGFCRDKNVAVLA